jgi:cytochrome c oxidase subunit III
MAEHKKNIKQESLRSTFEKIDKIHPHKMLMYLFIFGSSMVFLFMILAYTVSDANMIGYGMPKAFIVSSMIMLISSFNMSKIISAFEEEKIYKVRNALAVTLSLALIFSLCQYIGWQQLKVEGIFFEGKSEAIYLYVISGLHLGLFVLAVAFLSVVLVESMKVSNDPVKVLIKTTNPYEKVRLEMLNVFWQYLTVLWIVLFFYFLMRF